MFADADSTHASRPADAALACHCHWNGFCVKFSLSTHTMRAQHHVQEVAEREVRDAHACGGSGSDKVPEMLVNSEDRKSVV